MNVQHETLFSGNDAGSHDWLTPPEIIRALPEFDLDPCASKVGPRIGKKNYTVDDDGLHQPWEGLVYCNPPYGAHAAAWLEKCAEHDHAIALIFARTETSYFQKWVFGKAKALLFIAGRLKFVPTSAGQTAGTAGAPSVLVAYGEEAAELLNEAPIYGKYVRL